MTEVELLEFIKRCCKQKNKSALFKDYLEHLDNILSLEMRGCIKIDFKRERVRIEFVKSMPEDAVGIVDEDNKQTQEIFKLLLNGINQREVGKILKIGNDKISECARYLKNKGKM